MTIHFTKHTVHITNIVLFRVSFLFGCVYIRGVLGIIVAHFVFIQRFVQKVTCGVRHDDDDTAFYVFFFILFASVVGEFQIFSYLHVCQHLFVHKRKRKYRQYFRVARIEKKQGLETFLYFFFHHVNLYGLRVHT